MMKKLYKISYELDSIKYTTKQEFKSVNDFIKLLEIQNKDISKYENIRKLS